MSINEIVNYVNRTPHNTNPNVIASMVQGANEQAVYESVEKLKQDGGVGYLGKRFFTFDGNIEGKHTIELDDMILYNIANEAPDLNTIAKVRGVMDGQLIEVTGENFEIQTGSEGIISVSAARWQGVPFVATTIVDENPELYVHPWLRYIEFEDTVHTIDPKYLPSGMGGGMPVFDFTDLKDAWEPFEEDENILFALIPVERAAEAALSIYSLFASKKYAPVTVAVQLYDDILILPCAVAMQEGGARLCGKVSFGTEGSIYVIVTLSNTDVVRPHIMMWMA